MQLMYSWSDLLLVLIMHFIYLFFFLPVCSHMWRSEAQEKTTEKKNSVNTQDREKLGHIAFQQCQWEKAGWRTCTRATWMCATWSNSREQFEILNNSIDSSIECGKRNPQTQSEISGIEQYSTAVFFILMWIELPLMQQFAIVVIWSGIL